MYIEKEVNNTIESKNITNWNNKYIENKLLISKVDCAKLRRQKLNIKYL